MHAGLGPPRQRLANPMTIAEDDPTSTIESDDPELAALLSTTANAAALPDDHAGQPSALGQLPPLASPQGEGSSSEPTNGPVPGAPPLDSAGEGAYRPKHAKPGRHLATMLRSNPWAAGGVAFFAATAAVNLSNFVFHVAVSRLLGPANYSALGSLLNVLVIISVPLGALKAAVTQAEARSRGTGGGVAVKSLVIRAALWSLVATALLIGLSPEVKSFLHFSSPWSVVVLSAWILPAAIGAVLQGVLMGRVRFALVAYAMAGGTGLGRLALGVVLVAAGLGVEGAVAASVIGQVITTVALLPLLRHDLFPRSSGGGQERVGGRQALLSLLALGGFAVLVSMDTVLARHYLAPRDAGWYTAAATGGRIAMFLPGAVALIAFPRFSVGDGRSREARSALRLAFPATFGLGLLAALVMLGFSGVVVSLLFGSRYQGAHIALGILGLEAMLLGLVSLLIYFHLARRSMAALLSWSGVLVGVLMVVLFHRDPEAIALDMLVAAGSALVLAIPAAGRSLLGSSKPMPSDDSRPRLLLLNWRDSEHRRAGGSEVYAERVAEAWGHQGYHVTLLTRSFAGAASQVERDGYKLVRRGNTLTMQWHAWRYYRRHAHELAGVVEFVNALPFLTPLYVRRSPGIALFHQTTEEIWAHELPRPLAAIGRYLLEPLWLRCYRNFTVLAVSESTRAALTRLGLRSVGLAPEGADTVISLTDKPPKEPVPTVLFVGRLTSNKRPDHALKAFRELKRHLPDATLWVVGDGPMLPKLRASAPPGTTFFGRVSQAKKHELMARAHVLVATSVREGWGLAVSEAALCGTRAVGYDVAGLHDSVPAAGGVLVEPEPTALASALTQLLPAWAKDYGPLPTDVGVRSWENVATSLMGGLAAATGNAKGTASHGWRMPRPASQLAWASYGGTPPLPARAESTGPMDELRSIG